MSLDVPTYILRAREGTGGHGEGTGGHRRGAGGSLALFRDVFGLHGPYTHALGHGEGTEKHGRARGGHGEAREGTGGVREGAGGCGRGWGGSFTIFRNRIRLKRARNTAFSAIPALDLGPAGPE
jgi:hypothetical protein